MLYILNINFEIKYHIYQILPFDSIGGLIDFFFHLIMTTLTFTNYYKIKTLFLQVSKLIITTKYIIS